MINQNVSRNKFLGTISFVCILAYDGPFSWRNYLTEINQEPVPFECFAYVRDKHEEVKTFPPHIIS